MIKIEKINDKKKIVKTPYHPEFNQKIKKMGAKWDQDRRGWIFESEKEEYVKKILKEVFRTDGQDQNTVDVILKFKERTESERDSIRAFGVPIVRAYGRDSGADMQSGAELLEGDIGSGGSARYWRTVVEAGSIIKVPRVPMSSVMAFTEERDGERVMYINDEEVVVEIADNREERLKQLKKRKEELLKELEEIDGEIKKLEGKDKAKTGKNEKIDKVAVPEPEFIEYTGKETPARKIDTKNPIQADKFFKPAIKSHELHEINDGQIIHYTRMEG